MIPRAVLLPLLCLLTIHATAAAAPGDRQRERGTRRAETRLFDRGTLPGVEEVQRWAAEAVDLPGAERRLRRSHGRGALPTVRLRAGFDGGQDRDFDELDLQESRGEDRKLSVDLWLEWDLADLAGNTDVARAARERRATYELQQAVLAQVTATWFDRERLRVEALLAADEDLAARVERRLRLQELDATLSALTGGRWGEALRRLSSRKSAGASRLRGDGRREAPR